MTQNRWLVGAAVCTALFVPLSHAQYIGPNAVPKYTSVKDVLAQPVQGARVSLTGFITKRLGDDRYLFSDGGKEIRVEIDAKYFPATPVSEKTKVSLVGEVEKSALSAVEIEVDAPLNVSAL